MAKLVEEIVIVKITRVVKEAQEAGELLTPTLCDSIDQIVQELVGSGAVVEVERA